MGSRWLGAELMDVGRACVVVVEVWWEPCEGLELKPSAGWSCGGSRCEVELNALLLHGVKPSGEDIGSAQSSELADEAPGGSRKVGGIGHSY